MCLATPCKILNIQKNQATVQSGGHLHRVDTSLLKNLKPGDYVLIHGDLAIGRVSKRDALRVLGILKSIRSK
jgi:hydrogenase expression/formation protein HypC